MAPSSIYESSLFEDLRQGREGIQCERSLRLLLFLYDGWCKYAAGQRGFSTPQGLTAIPFDKFAMLALRLWDALFRALGDHSVEGESGTHVTFPSPFQAIPGKHGSGPGRWEGPGRQPTYLLDILFELQREELLHYFRITPPRHDKDNPKNYKTTILPALPITGTHEFLNGFNPTEQKALFAMQSVLKHLEPQELRSLGTHHSQKDTINDIKREFDYIGRVTPEIVSRVEENQSFTTQARTVLEYADEAWRKACYNQQSYSKGYQVAVR